PLPPGASRWSSSPVSTATGSSSRSTAARERCGSTTSRFLARYLPSSALITSSAPVASRPTSGRSRRTRCNRLAGVNRYPVSMAMGTGFEKFLRMGEGRRMKRLAEQASYIATLEPEFHALSDAELRAKTAEFRQRLDDGEDLNDLLFEAFAAVREARLRESDQRMFDVQMMGGIGLHEGDVAEMKTGEGKTFVASLALYLNALPTVETYDGRTLGQGVHLVTVNDYLAERDAEWNRGVFERLGMTVDYIQAELNMDFEKRKAAYEADITYGTNSEFGFDYLRDNMAVSFEGVVQ